MGPGICYNCCPVQFLQPSDLLTHTLGLLFLKLPIKLILSQFQRLLTSKINPWHTCGKSRNSGSEEMLDQDHTGCSIVLNSHIPLPPEQDRQLLLYCSEKCGDTCITDNILLFRTSLGGYLSGKNKDSKNCLKYVRTSILCFNKYNHLQPGTAVGMEYSGNRTVTYVFRFQWGELVEKLMGQCGTAKINEAGWRG